MDVSERAEPTRSCTVTPCPGSAHRPPVACSVIREHRNRRSRSAIIDRQLAATLEDQASTPTIRGLLSAASGPRIGQARVARHQHRRISRAADAPARRVRHTIDHPSHSVMKAPRFLRTEEPNPFGAGLCHYFPRAPAWKTQTGRAALLPIIF